MLTKLLLAVVAVGCAFVAVTSFLAGDDPRQAVDVPAYSSSAVTGAVAVGAAVAIVKSAVKAILFAALLAAGVVVALAYFAEKAPA